MGRRMLGTVRTTGGLVRGERRETSTAYRGIAYAAAPFADLRFAAPAPHPGWDGVRDAVGNGPTPALTPASDTHSIPEPTYPGDEILNLNVFTPNDTPASARLGVYVWIHGGGYVAGSPGGEWFDGASFAARGVVTVALTYRLGFEGFGQVPGAPENRALLDVLAALAWVRENIAAFGGDPDRITVGGQSAGGGIVLALLACPQAQDLFHAAVVHSAPLPDITPERAASRGAAMAALCGIDHTLQAWRGVSREDIVAAERRLDPGDLWSGVKDLRRLLSATGPVTQFGPVIGTELLPTDPIDALRSGLARNKPLLLGVTSHEFNRALEPLARVAEPLARTPLLAGLGLPAALARAYPRAYPESTASELLGQAVTDRVFRVPALAVALVREGALAEEPPAGQPEPPQPCDGGASVPEASAPRAGTWLWDFRWRSPVRGLAVHCLDLPFAWNRLGRDRVERIAGPTPPEALAEAMHGSIAAFVATGEPGWPPFRPAEPTARVFDTASWTGADPFRFERIAALEFPERVRPRGDELSELAAGR